HLLHSPITDPAPPLIYTLSLHDALPILPILESFVTKYPGHKQVPDAQYLLGWARVKSGDSKAGLADLRAFVAAAPNHELAPAARSEEHTSELQSLRHLVCRLLLEKKKKK